MSLSLLTPEELVHRAIHAQPEGEALRAAKELLKGLFTTIEMIREAGYTSHDDDVKVLLQGKMLQHNDTTTNDLARLSVYGASDEIALKAIWKLISHKEATTEQLCTAFSNGQTAIVRLRAGEALVSRSETPHELLLVVAVEGNSESLQGAARERLALMS